MLQFRSEAAASRDQASMSRQKSRLRYSGVFFSSEDAEEIHPYLLCVLLEIELELRVVTLGVDPMESHNKQDVLLGVI
jgi:hypothetical protein